MLTVHPDEVELGDDVVRGLLARQFPAWAGRPLRRVPTDGTDNVLFRLGDDLQVRLPRLRPADPTWGRGQIEKDAALLPRLSPALPVDIPCVVAVGEPDETYPYIWAVYRWLDGDVPTVGTAALARDVAAFVAALQQVDPADGEPGRSRGGPLELRDRPTREALARLEGEIDVVAATAAWEAALGAPAWSHAPVWLHGDLLEGNLLARDGRLAAVLDWSCACVGDPAFDYVTAWSLFAPVRAELRAACGVDDATWARARGLALSQALIALPYYRHTNPPVAERSRRVVAAVLAET